MTARVTERLKESALKNNCVLVKKENGHFQIRGKFLVNYYPFSKQRTAYIAGTGEGRTNIEPEQAVKMASKLPSLPKNNKKRPTNNINLRKRLLRKHPFCVWCGKKLTPETSTLEHLIPRSRGGLDNMNNYAIACGKCNQARGNFC